jgi:hypothetical protein
MVPDEHIGAGISRQSYGLRAKIDGLTMIEVAIWA